MINITTAGLDGLGIVALVAGGVVTLFSATSRQTKTDQRELINTIQEQRDADREVFNKRITALEGQKQDNIKAIARLEGQIMAYKDIPLQSIAASMEKMAGVNAHIADSNERILQTLKSSAIIAATDRDVLTGANGNQVIQEQTVEHQTVKST